MGHELSLTRRAGLYSSGSSETCDSAGAESGIEAGACRWPPIWRARV